MSYEHYAYGTPRAKFVQATAAESQCSPRLGSGITQVHQITVLQALLPHTYSGTPWWCQVVPRQTSARPIELSAVIAARS